MKKWLYIVVLASGLGVFALVSAHNAKGVDPVYDDHTHLQKGAVGGINFQGKGIILHDKSGKRLNPTKLDTSKGRTIAEATIRLKKVNPCVMEWCPDGDVYQVYVIPDVDQCPAWW